MSKLLKLTSSHDPAHTNHSQWRYNVGTGDRAIHEVRGLILVSAIIPNTQYNVNSNNNVLRYDLNGAGVASLTVPIGQYTTASLMAYIQSQIAGTTITQNATTQKINWATTQSLDLYSEEDDPLSTLAPFLGIYTTLNILAASNDDSESVPNLNGTDMFFIESNELASNNMISSVSGTSAQTKSVIASIPVDVQFGYNQTYEYRGASDSLIRYSSPRNINNIDIRITDQYHNSLTLNSPSTLIFRIYT